MQGVLSGGIYFYTVRNMSLQLNIKQFISLLNQGKDTIDLLFGQKDSIQKEEVVALTRPEYFKQDAKQKYLRGIKKVLRKINFTTTREIIKLDKVVDDAYKNEET